MTARRSQQRGVALITALLITAIVAVLAVGMASRQQLDIRRTGNIFDSGQTYLYALGVENWARGLLAKDMVKNAQADNLNEDWATALAPIEVEGGKVAGQIEDLQGRFNLNNLVGPDDQPSAEDVKIFQRLLSSLKLEPELAQPLVDWIDKNVELTIPSGAEDAEYLKRTPPYRAANRPLVSVTELLLVKGYTPQVYQALAPFVTALPTLPESTKINVNTAPAPVLAALADGVSASDANALLNARKVKPYANVDEFRAHPALAGRALPVDKLAVSSRYFLVVSSSQAGRGQVQLYSVVQRSLEGNVKVIERGQGSY